MATDSAIRVTGGREPLDVVTKNRTWVLCKSSPELFTAEPSFQLPYPSFAASVIPNIQWPHQTLEGLQFYPMLKAVMRL